MGPISIIDVERAWREHSKGRALGGRRALAGFSYQIYLSLSRFFRSVADGSRAGAFAFDGLSDLAEERQGLTYLTQVKSTLSLEALKSAATEALAVDRFLEDRWPTLRDAYRYGVVGRRRPRSLPEIAEIPPADLGLRGAEAERWMRVRERFGPVSVQPDPFLDLAIFLFPRVGRTFSFLDSATGKLLALLGDDCPSDEIARSLLELLDASRVDEAPPGEILGPHSWNATVLDGPLVLVGERPTVEDVAAGRFMERPRRVHAILQQIHDILLEPRSGLTTVLWLEGTSGAGKSVLLLQVLRELTFQDGSVVHWLQHFPHRLAEAFGYWQGQSSRSFIGVDDLFAPDHRNLSELWNAFYETTAKGEWPMGRPLLVTAGPSEYREAFEDQAYRRGSLAIQRIEVDALGPVERDEVRTWYGQRTEWDAPAIPEDNFVSHVFTYELHRLSRTPDLRGFTARFKERLVELGVLDATRSALALNRFGILAPEELFAHAPGALDQLQRERILRARRLESAVGLQLFHATIAETLYGGLRPVERVAERAGDLVRAIETVLADHERARILLDAFSGSKNGKKLGKDLRARLARDLWRSVERIEPPGVPIGLLFSLFGGFLDAIEPRARAIANRLQSWMADDQMDEMGWASLFQFLGKIAPQEIGDEHLHKAESLLRDHSDWPSWSYVWQVAWRIRPTSNLVDLALRWLPEHASDRGWGYVFQPLFEHDPRLPGLRSIARSGLEGYPVSMADPYLWEKAATLLETSEMAQLITGRLARTQNPLIHDRGLRYLFDELHIGPDQLIEAIGRSSGEDHYPQLLQDVLHRREEDAFDLGAEWLSGHEDRPAWSHVWRRLVELRPEDTELFDTGQRWLRDREDRPEWNYVWQRLVELRPEDTDLFDTGQRWLRDREDRRGWNYVWRRLFELLPTDRD
ncbi:MAG TPA: hypothetical protein VNB06_21625, partial [Thermoanaerobaculia bacterium]|nr:hypothetical protein [Thermoanaerobaculia bacterium]